MYQIGATQGTMQDVLVYSNVNTRLSKPRVVRYNVDGETIVQIGSKYRVWSGEFSVSSRAEYQALESLYKGRSLYFSDSTTIGSSPVQVLWTGSFPAVYETPEEPEVFSISFELEEI